VYGPLSCAPAYKWDVGHPAVAQPCHATGAAISLFGRLQALPGVQADVSLTLQDAASGRTVAGPFTCFGLMFTDFARQHECGPFRVSDIAHGHRYVVVQRWEYTGRAVLPAGTARDDPFPW
jgi:serine/threonine-protein kinase